MKYFLSFVIAILLLQPAHAQVIITSADMPVDGDMLSYSNAPTTGTGFDPGDSGVNRTWNYILSSTSQGVDTYKLAPQVNPNFASTISISAVGYKVADSIPGLSQLSSTVLMSPIPISISNIYTYFQEITTPRSAYMASAYSYTFANIFPTATNYTDPDVWYFFPLTYNHRTDSQNYRLTLSLMSLATIREVGYRRTRVDGFGTITTPYYTTPVNCIRVRSEIFEIDSITVQGMTFGTPRNSVEYKWMVNGEHYPALWITSNVMNGTETPTTIRYRDTIQNTSVIVSTKPAIYEITAYPNPSANGVVTLGIPADWTTFTVEVFDIQSKQVALFNNERQVNISSLPSGNYIARITSGVKTGYVKLVK